MDLKWIILIISILVLKVSGELDEFCTISGNVKGLSDQSDFSSIFVKLLNKQGNLKEKTEIAENGFFILPIYDKGDYTIKVDAPAGYSFEPEEIAINFDGICTQKTDVNFMFKGFGITGKVSILNNPTGAKDVTIKLFNDKEVAFANTVTDDNGIFTFSPIVPGSYKVQASHSSWHFSKFEHSVTVTTGNTKLPENSLIISGFNLEGSIAQPAVKFGLLIYSKKGQSLQKCNEQLPKDEIKQSLSIAYNSEPFCYTNADKNGDYSFNNLATGSYLIVPFIGKDSIEFNISPASIEVEIKTDNVKLQEKFSISGFTANGKILLSQNKKTGVKEAIIKINEKEVAKTDDNGSYTLKNIQEGTYTLQITANDLKFKDENVKISMENPKITDIYVSGFKVCGKVVSDTSFKVLIKDLNSQETYEAQSDPNQGGLFCTFLGNGKYSLEVQIEEVERKSGLQFYPIQQTFEVNSAAVSDIIFSQLRAKVKGEVKCLPDDDSCQNIEVTLSSIDENGRQISSQKSKLINGIYEFDEILPGRYQITVPTETICWENNQQKLIVKSTLENVPKFQQNGYKIGPIISTHNSQGTYKLRSAENAKEVTVELSSGANEICVEKSGTYDLKITGCHVYEENTKVLSTKNKSPVYINALKHRNGIRILSEMNQQFTIEVQYEDEKKEVLKPVELSERVDGYAAYKLYLDLKSGETIKLTPKSEQMLFKPPSTEIRGAAADCVDVAFNFIATKGLVINGKTKPAIDQTVITLSFPKNNELSPITTLTNKNGEFKFPTIDPTVDYELKAEKESYVFQDYDATRNIFEGHKLCEIIVRVKDEEAKELANAVISMSGDNYRKNLPTASNGEIKFHSLKPGKYFLRAMMKEYEFKPNSQTIDIKDGETLTIDLSAKRVAYSVFGKITTLSGDSFGSVSVEAISTSEKCSNHQEEATTEFNGQYRIRGLQTGCDYKIRLQKNSNVDRSLPAERKIHVETIDTQNVNFIAINPINICDVIVKIRSKTNDYYKTLKLQLFKRDSPDSPVYSQRIENLMMPKSKHNDDIMVFLPRITSSDFHKTYFIELTTTLSEKNYNYKLPTLQFTANTSNIYFEVDFNPQLRQPESELNKSSLVALVLIFLVAFVFLKQELVFEIVKGLIARFNNDTGKQTAKKTEGKGEKFIDEKEINELAQFIEEKKKKKSKKNN
ncbi:hypothetical protein PVAND_004070 [Polypedilum vanderplanki]|uniref:Uncharacterized protein n=1 Tax=Polypedilum vanderplanki TaxID=319348 RepID=A0A9J6BX14_POLVA|nr:hypothetical protein PVAND_004070 [Polypedilum vanderplanki]